MSIYAVEIYITIMRVCVCASAFSRKRTHSLDWLFISRQIRQSYRLVFDTIHIALFRDAQFAGLVRKIVRKEKCRHF